MIRKVQLWVPTAKRSRRGSNTHLCGNFRLVEVMTKDAKSSGTVHFACKVQTRNMNIVVGSRNLPELTRNGCCPLLYPWKQSLEHQCLVWVVGDEVKQIPRRFGVPGCNAPGFWASASGRHHYHAFHHLHFVASAYAGAYCAGTFILKASLTIQNLAGFQEIDACFWLVAALATTWMQIIADTQRKIISTSQPTELGALRCAPQGSGTFGI